MAIAGRSGLRWTLVAAVVAVGCAAWAAPRGWESGSASLEITVSGELAAVIGVEIGSLDPVLVTTDTLVVEVPNGLPVDAPVTVEVVIAHALGSVGLGDVEIALTRDDGFRELVPVLSNDDRNFSAARTPPNNSTIVFMLLAGAVVLWVSEAVPLVVTSLTIPVVLSVADVGTAQEALAPFFDPIIVLFFGGFLMAEAMKRTGLDRRLAVLIVDVVGTGPVRLYGAFVFLGAFMSMWMSNTAAVAVLLPVAMSVTEPLDAPGYRKTVVLGVAYAATIGGVGSAIGTPANPMAIEFIERLTGREITFVGWFAFGLPMVLIFLPMLLAYLWRIGDTSVDPERFDDARSVAAAERRHLGSPTREEGEVLLVFLAVVAVWLTQSWHGLNTGVVALAGAIVLFVLGRIDADDLGRISWTTLLTFGGGLTLGTFMVTTGSSDWLVSRLGGLDQVPETLAVALVALAALGLTTVASNTAAAATLIPLAVPLAGLIGVDPVLLVVVVAVATSIDFALVIGTPPTMLAYSTELFTAREILAKGSVLDIVGIAVLVLAVVPIWRLVPGLL